MWSQYILLALFFMDSLTDGEFSVLTPLEMLWTFLLDRFIFFSPDFMKSTMEIIAELLSRA